MDCCCTFIDKHNDEGVTRRVDSRKRVVAERSDNVISLLDEACALLAYIVVLHLGIRLLAETAFDGTPLVVVLFHILPVNPCPRLDVAHIINKFLGKVEVATYAASSFSHLTHPQRFLRLIGQMAYACTIGVVSAISMGVPLPHKREHSARHISLEGADRLANACFVRCGYYG